MKKPSSKIREEIARLQDQLRAAETREAERSRPDCAEGRSRRNRDRGSRASGGVRGHRRAVSRRQGTDDRKEECRRRQDRRRHVHGARAWRGCGRRWRGL